jgi:hypothetical protein
VALSRNDLAEQFGDHDEIALWGAARCWTPDKIRAAPGPRSTLVAADWTPEGRAPDWYPKLDYGHK